MKRYEKYKPSGIEWLGEIPEHWEVCRIKNTLKAIYGGGTPSTEILDYWNGNIPWVSAKDMKSDKIAKSEDYVTEIAIKNSASRLIKPNKVLFVARSGILKHTLPVAINIVPVAINQDLKALDPKSKINTEYLFYSLKGLSLSILMECNKVGATVDSVEIQEFLKFNITIPSLSEQTAIANYLNTKTAAIDRKIELLTAKADKYKALRRSLINETVCRGLPASEGFTPSETLIKMKDSGIEWIGMIPEHWEEYRMKDLGFLYSGLSGKAGDDFNQDENENNCDFIPFTNIFNNDTINPDVMGKVVVFENEKQNRVKKNDLFFLMSSEDYDGLGKSSLLSVDLKNTYLNSFCKGFRVTKKYIMPAFLNYQLQSDTFRKIMQIEGKGFTRLNLKMEKVNDFTVYIPNTIEEQAAIVKYLNEKNTQIDTILTNISNQINKLTQLRKTLINDVVTGKIKVTE